MRPVPGICVHKYDPGIFKDCVPGPGAGSGGIIASRRPDVEGISRDDGWEQREESSFDAAHFRRKTETVRGVRMLQSACNIPGFN